MLERLGAELCLFSPLTDAALPPGCSGMLLGGGYPELHAAELERNAPMRESVRAAVQDGMPCVAECGGFLYLHRTLEDAQAGFPIKWWGRLQRMARGLTGCNASAMRR